MVMRRLDGSVAVSTSFTEGSVRLVMLLYVEEVPEVKYRQCHNGVVVGCTHGKASTMACCEGEFPTNSSTTEAAITFLHLVIHLSFVGLFSLLRFRVLPKTRDQIESVQSRTGSECNLHHHPKFDAISI